MISLGFYFHSTKIYKSVILAFFMIITRKQLIKAYIEFFKSKEHKQILNASLLPEEHDPTVLFTTAGMHPLVPYLLGQPHPLGKRLVNVQKCIRTGDIDIVGDAEHLTFFEMLGNWSLGDFWKKQAIKWSFEFLTDKLWLGLDPKKLHITIFKGDKDAPHDIEAEKAWLSVGIPKERIYFYGKKDNWWGPAGASGPCGPCTEMFYDTGKKACSKKCRPGCFCGKYFEIWNDVFMEYNKTAEGYKKLKQKNVDTGMGVERTITMLQNKKTVYETELFLPIIEKIKEISKIKKSDEKQEKSTRIIADHIKAAVFILAEKVLPGNVDKGYVLRRLIRRAIRHGKLLGIEKIFCSDIARVVIDIYRKDYPLLEKNKEFISSEIEKEEKRFRDVLEKGLKKFEKISEGKKTISGKDTFLLFQSYGFPIEMTEEIAKEQGKRVDVKGYYAELKKHQEISRKGAEKRFKGGLADYEKETIKLHTTTHLLNQALRDVLNKKDIVQKGSNITPERLRFDFNFDRKLTDKETREVENLVNKKIAEALPIRREEMSLEEARKKGAQAMFEKVYGKGKISVYLIGKLGKEFSIEVCAGPHVKNTKELGKFKIIKEESIAAGIRRIKAVLK